MGGLKRNPWLSSLGVLLAVLVMSGGYVRADVTTDQPGSIIIFPKVISDGVRDTIITIVNVSNMPTVAHCFYNDSPTGSCSVTTGQPCRVDTDCPTTPSPEFCVTNGQCKEIDFTILLSGQQPTVWLVSLGRDNPIGPPPPIDGLEPGQIPQQPNFVGELKCYVADPSDLITPLPGNSLLGTATLRKGIGRPTDTNLDFSEYSAITVATVPSAVLTGFDLQLDGTHYNACPSDLVVNHFAEGFQAGAATISTELTLVPCSEDLNNQLAPPARALFEIFNEFEQPVSTAVDVGCFLNRKLSDIPAPDPSGHGPFSIFTLGSAVAKSRITTPSGKVCYAGDNAGLSCNSDSDCTNTPPTALGCLPPPGLLAVYEEFYTTSLLPSGTNVGTAAANSHMVGKHAAGDTIVLPVP